MFARPVRVIAGGRTAALGRKVGEHKKKRGGKYKPWREIGERRADWKRSGDANPKRVLFAVGNARGVGCGV